jgi:hypothetical protein
MENGLKWILSIIIGAVITVLFTKYLNQQMFPDKVIIDNPTPIKIEVVTPKSNNDKLNRKDEIAQNTDIDYNPIDTISADSKNINYTVPERQNIENATKKDVSNTYQSTTITIVYRGDKLGCMLNINIDIGGALFTPTGTSYRVSGIPVGNQKYSIRGTIYSQYVGSCNANGDGYIEVKPNSTFYVIWSNTSYGQCGIILSNQ